MGGASAGALRGTWCVCVMCVIRMCSAYACLVACVSACVCLLVCVRCVYV